MGNDEKNKATNAIEDVNDAAVEEKDEDLKAEKVESKPEKKATVVDIATDEKKKAKKKNKADDEKSEVAAQMLDEKTSAKHTARTEPSKLYFSLSLLVVVAAIVVYLFFGIAPSLQNIGGRIYVAKLPSVVAEETVPALIEDIVAITGSNSNVSVKESLSTSESYVEIAVLPGETIDEQAVVTKLNSSYVDSTSDKSVESLSHRDVAPALSTKNIVTLLVVFVLLVLAVLLLTSIFVDGASALYVTAMVLHDALITASLFVLCRVPSPRIFIAAILVVCIASPYFNITKIAALKTSLIGLKKNRRIDALNEVAALEAVRGVDTLVVGAIVCVAFATVGIIFNVAAIAYASIMIFAAFALALYSSVLFMPNLWAARK